MTASQQLAVPACAADERQSQLVSTDDEVGIVVTGNENERWSDPGVKSCDTIRLVNVRLHVVACY